MELRGRERQTAYRILAQTEGKTVWDSGKVPSERMRAAYPEALSSRQRVETDAAGEWSEQAFFETGLLSAGDWTAKWISGNYRVNRKKRYPADCFRKVFSVSDVRRARLYVTACGVYEVHINGRRAGNFVLAPGHTDYTKRIQYQTYDVTSLIKEGENALTCELADGWYRGSCGAWGLKNQYGTQTKLLLQLEVYGADGSCTRICSDESCSGATTAPSALRTTRTGRSWRPPAPLLTAGGQNLQSAKSYPSRRTTCRSPSTKGLLLPGSS